MQYLGMDVGTSSLKAIVVNEAGDVLGSSTPEYAYQTPRPQWAETDPEIWWEATVKAIRDLISREVLDPGELAAIGLSGQMHGMVLLGADGKVLRPCIMWNDQRTAKQCATITERVGEKRVLELTGNPVLTGFTAPKVVWVQENEPEVYRQVAHMLLPKDYIRYRLTGEFFSEMSDSSGTSLLDVRERRWSDEMLEACGVSKEWLPELTEGTVASTKLSDSAAAAVGLKADTPIIAGGGDQAAQAVGSGIISEGLVSATLGTSGVVFAASDEYRVEPEGRLHAFCHAVPGQWHLMGVMLSAAGSFQWYRNQLGRAEVFEAEASGANAFDLLTRAAAGVPAGSEGCLFLPYLSGERTPYPDPDATGAYFGLTTRHTKAHLTRATLEGITFGMRDSLELMRALGIQPEEVRASGGGAKSPFWLQMQADIYSARITTLNVTEGAAYGAALLATVGCGTYATVHDACSVMIKQTGSVDPGEQRHIYDKVYPHYQALYPALQERFKARSALVEELGS